jgi:pyridoxine 4-dehydrogenase
MNRLGTHGYADYQWQADRQRITTAHGVTPAQVRLAWTLHQGPHVLAIPGTGNRDHLAANVAAAALRLAPGEVARLEAMS